MLTAAEIWQRASKRALIDRALKDESYLRIFTEGKERAELNGEVAWVEMQRFMKQTLGEEKFREINDFVLTPLAVVSLSESLLTDVFKVFDAVDAHFNIQTVKNNGGEQLQRIFEEIDLQGWIQSNGKKVLRNKPNTAVVLTKGSDQVPTVETVEVSRIIDFQFSKDDLSFDYFLYKKGETSVEGRKVEHAILCDSENYTELIKDGGSITIVEVVPHDLGYCPARMFLDRPNSTGNKISRKSPLSSVISNLKGFQLFKLYKFYTDHYAPFPVTEMMREPCANPNCVNGIIHEDREEVVNGKLSVKTVLTKCNLCGDKNKIRVGGKVFIDPAEDGEESASGKFKFITPDTSNLDYIKNTIEIEERYIRDKVVGVDSLVSKEAVNERQVKGSFESKTTVLFNLKSNFDELYKWIAFGIARLHNNSPINVSVNFGTQWYLNTAEQVSERYNLAKEQSMPAEILNEIYLEYLQVKYRTNPAQIKRFKMINEVNPCSHLSTEEKQNLLNLQLISRQEFVLSERLPIFVDRFERENGIIADFGTVANPNDTIEVFRNQLIDYARQYITENQNNVINE